MTTFRSNNPEDQHNPHWIGELAESRDESDTLLEFLKDKNEHKPTAKDVLGFVPITKKEETRASKLYQAYTENPESGVAKYLSTIARNKTGGKVRALASVFKTEMIQPYNDSLKAQQVLEVAIANAPELGNTLFEDPQYQDDAREQVREYLNARQRTNRVPEAKRIGLEELMHGATTEDVIQLVEEVHANLVLRENFWHRIIDSARKYYPNPLNKIAEDENVPSVDGDEIVQTDYRRGTKEDPHVKDKRNLDDMGLR